MPAEAVTLSLPAEPIDLRLVVTDLDGTLLDEDGRLPETLWVILRRLRERGIILAPASGRQYATLRRLFARVSKGMPFIAENGTFVVMDGAELSSTPLERRFVRELVTLVRALQAQGHDLGLVWCARDAAYIERRDPRFSAEVANYYAELRSVDDLLQVESDAIKCAVFDFGKAELGAGPLLSRACGAHQVVASSEHWVDIMHADANKGAALKSLQETLGISPEQTVVFGDYLNDLEMLSNAPHSFAMANAHPAVIQAARYLAPTNRQHGVVQILERLLERFDSAAQGQRSLLGGMAS